MSDNSSGSKFTKIYLMVWAVFIFVGLVAFVLYKAGFRLTNNFSPVKVGAIDFVSNQSDLQVFLDNREKSVSNSAGAYHLANVTPGFHSLMVSKDGFWPWAKTFLVSENSTRKVFAFMFPMNGLTTAVVSQKDPGYKNYVKKIAENVLPEELYESSPYDEKETFASWVDKNIPNRKLSFDKSTALFVGDNTIYLAWVSETEAPPHYFCQENPCKLKIPVTISNDPIKNVDFYKDRRDLVIFSSGSTIYAIEADREGTQNFQPLFKGEDPYFYETPSGLLYIGDGGKLFTAEL